MEYKRDTMTFEEATTHITHAFMEMLNLAESMFGDRDKNWTFIGIEYEDNGPFIRYYPQNKISIVLSSNCSEFIPHYPQLYYQLSHEVCHLLYPTGSANANVLNEGISTYFSRVYIEKRFPGNDYALRCISKSKYYRPYTLVEELMEINPNAIKEIRKICPRISDVTKQQLNSLNLGLSESKIEELVQKF